MPPPSRACTAPPLLAPTRRVRSTPSTHDGARRPTHDAPRRGKQHPPLLHRGASCLPLVVSASGKYAEPVVRPRVGSATIDPRSSALHAGVGSHLATAHAVRATGAAFNAPSQPVTHAITACDGRAAQGSERDVRSRDGRDERRGGRRCGALDRTRRRRVHRGAGGHAHRRRRHRAATLAPQANGTPEGWPRDRRPSIECAACRRARGDAERRATGGRRASQRDAAVWRGGSVRLRAAACSRVQSRAVACQSHGVRQRPSGHVGAGGSRAAHVGFRPSLRALARRRSHCGWRIGRALGRAKSQRRWRVRGGTRAGQVRHG